MVKLIETTNVSLNTNQRQLGGQAYHTIAAIGDGNCAFNALTLALVDLIKRDQFRLENHNTQQALLGAVLASRRILEQRLALYRDQPSTFTGKTGYSDLADDLARFISILGNDLTYPQLIQYVKDNSGSRLQVAALHVAFAPALRNTAVQLHQVELAALGNEQMLREARTRSADGAAAGHTELTAIAKQLGINLHIYSSANAVVEYPTHNIVGAPHVSLVHEPAVSGEDHWNFVVPVAQQDGVVAAIKPVVVSPANIENVLGETEALVVKEERIATEFDADNQLIAGKLSEVAGVIKHASKNLLAINAADQADQAADYEALLVRHSDSTKSILTAVRHNLGLTKATLNSLKPVSALEEELLLGTAVPELPDEDTRLAHTLQNTYVLSFLSRHYATLHGAKSGSEPLLDLPADPAPGLAR
jgi:hypothetical protein